MCSTKIGLDKNKSFFHCWTAKYHPLDRELCHSIGKSSLIDYSLFFSTDKYTNLYNVKHSVNEDGRLKCLLDEAFKQKESYEVEYSIKVNGNLLYVLEREFPLFKEEEFCGYEGYTIDITERKKYENSLYVKKQLEDFIYQSTNIGVLMTDQSGYFSLINQTALKMFGYKDEVEVLGKITPKDIHDPNEIRDFVIKFNQENNTSFAEDFEGFNNILAEYDLVQTNWKYYRKDGSIFYGTLNVRMFKDLDGNVIGAIGNIVDVTSLREANRELLKVKEELELLFDSVPSIIFHKDDRNTIIRANKFAADTLGVDKDLLKNVRTEDYFPADDSAKYLLDDQEVIRSGLPKLGIEERYVNGEGYTNWIRTDKVPIKDIDGKFTKLLAIVTDITIVD